MGVQGELYSSCCRRVVGMLAAFVQRGGQDAGRDAHRLHRWTPAPDRCKYANHVAHLAGRYHSHMLVFVRQLLLYQLPAQTQLHGVSLHSGSAAVL